MKSIVTVDIDADQLTTTFDSWREALAAYSELPCETEADEEFWNEWLTSCQDTIKFYETERKEKVGPLNDEVSCVNKQYKDSLEPTQAFKVLAKAKIAGAHERRALAATAAKQAAQLAAHAGDSEAVYAALAALPDDVKGTGSSARFTWEPTVVDFAALPDVYKLPNVKELAAYGKAYSKHDFAPNIPGVAWKKIAVVSAKGTR